MDTVQKDNLDKVEVLERFETVGVVRDVKFDICESEFFTSWCFPVPDYPCLYAMSTD